MSDSNPAGENDRAAALMVKLGKPKAFYIGGETVSEDNQAAALMVKLGTPRVVFGGETVPLEEVPAGKPKILFPMRPEILTPEEILRLGNTEEVVGYLNIRFEGDPEQAAFRDALREAPPSRPRPTLSGLSDLADWFGLGLRKRLKALLGDYDAEVLRLHEARRYGAARWNAFLARWFFWWYVLRGPLDWIISTAIRAWRGGA